MSTSAFEPHLLGPWAVLSRLGKGGMAEALLAEHQDPRHTPRLVVIKRMLPVLRGDPRLRAMFADEARLSAQLHHPNVVEVLDVLELDGGESAMILELMDGGDVDRLNDGVERRKEKLPLSVMVYVASSLLRALAYAHAARDSSGKPLQLIHRDVTPGNILLTRSGEAKLGDFGVARANNQQRRTLTGEVKGKVAYMCPEMLGEKSFDQRADIFSAGVTLWELFAGRRLFNQRTEYDVMKAVLEGPIPSIRQFNPEVPPHLEQLILRALERDPEKRLQSAAEMEQHVGALLPSFRVNFRKELALRVERYVGGLKDDVITAMARPPIRQTPVDMPVTLSGRAGALRITNVPQPPTIPPPTTFAPVATVSERRRAPSQGLGLEVSGFGDGVVTMTGSQILARMARAPVPRDAWVRVRGLPSVLLPDLGRLWLLDAYAPAAPSSSGAVTGELTSPAELLGELREERATGALHLRGVREATVFLQGGALRYVMQADVPRGLAHALLPPEENDVDNVLYRSVETSAPFWSIAARSGVCTEAQLDSALQRLVLSRLEEVMRWHGARYTFHDRVIPPYVLPAATFPVSSRLVLA